VRAGIEPDVVYRTVNGVELGMDVAVPEGSGPFPVVICLHGGGWSMGSRKSFHGIIVDLAENGFVAASIEYRLAPAARHPAQVEDIRAAIRFLRANAVRWNIDRARVVLMGASAGAHLALLAGLPRKDRATSVQAVIDVSGPTDLRDWRMNETAERALRDSTGKSSDDLIADLLGVSTRSGPIVESASPVTLVRPESPPVLVVHWKEDQAVPSSQAERLLAALARAKVHSEAVWFEGRGHALNGPGVEQIVPRAIEFLIRVLRPHPGDDGDSYRLKTSKQKWAADRVN